MTVVIDPAELAALRASGVSNNPVVGIDSIYAQPGAWSAGGTTAIRQGDGSTYTYWQPGAYPAAATYDLDAAATVNMAAIASHNLGTAGAQIQPEYWDGAAWQLFGQAQDPTDNQVIVWLSQDVSADQFRWNVTDNGSATLAPVIGASFFGRAFRFDERFYRGYDDALYPTDVELLSNRSGAHILGTSVMGRASRITWSLEHLPSSPLEGEDFAGFVSDFNAGKGFFAAWRPDDYQQAYFANRAGGPVRIPNTGPQTRRSLSLDMSLYHE